MNKKLQRLIEYVWKRFTDSGREYVRYTQTLTEREIPIIYRQDVRKLLETIGNAGYLRMHSQMNDEIESILFESVDSGILIQVHRKGDLYRAYRQINDNNLESLALRITEPNRHLVTARNELNEAIKFVNRENTDWDKLQLADQLATNVRRAMAALLAME